MAQALEAERKENAIRLEQIEKDGGEGRADTLQRLEKMEADIDKQMTIMEETQKRINRVDTSEGSEGESPEHKLWHDRFCDLMRKLDVTDHDVVEKYPIHFNEFLRHPGGVGMSIPDNLQKALTVDSNTGGGFLVAEEFLRQLDKTLTETSNIRANARVLTIQGNSLPFPKETAKAVAVIVGEGGTLTADTTQAFGQGEIQTYKMAYAQDFSSEVIADAAFPLESELREWQARALAVLEGSLFVVGDNDGRPEGFTTNGTIQAAATSSGSNSTIGADADPLINMQVAIKDGYWGAAKWYFDRATFGAVRKLKSGDAQYMLVPGIAGAMIFTILGKPVVITPDMPTIAQNAYPIAYGDLRSCYTIVDKVGATMQRDPFTLNMTDMVRFVLYKRTGGGVVRPEAINLLKIST